MPAHYTDFTPAEFPLNVNVKVKTIIISEMTSRCMGTGKNEEE